MAKMDEDELQEILKANGLTVQTALDLIWLRTGAVIKARNVSKGLRDYGHLSETLTALFRLVCQHVRAVRELELARGQVSALIGELNQLKARGAT